MSASPDVEVRPYRADDRAAVEALYAEAFPDENLVPLVRALADEPAALLLVALGDGMVGHAGLTVCAITGSNAKVALLGPLAVASGHRRRGVGRAIVDRGVDELAARGAALVCALVCVLGDPAYYSRLGFAPERSVQPPYPLPEAWRGAWQSRRMIGSGNVTPAGRMVVPPPWRRPEPWAE